MYSVVLLHAADVGIRDLFDHYPSAGREMPCFIIRGNNCLSSKVVLLLVLYCNIVPVNIEKEGKSPPPMARQGFPGFLSWRRIPACLLPLQLNHSGILNCQKCNLEQGFLVFGRELVRVLSKARKG